MSYDPGDIARAFGALRKPRPGTCARPGCGKPFVRGAGAKYCSDACQQHVHTKAYRERIREKYGSWNAWRKSRRPAGQGQTTTRGPN